MDAMNIKSKIESSWGRSKRRKGGETREEGVSNEQTKRKQGRKQNNEKALELDDDIELNGMNG